MLGKAKESIGSKGFMKRNQEEKDVASDVASKHASNIVASQCCSHNSRNSDPVAKAAAGRPSNGVVAGELKTCALAYGNVTFKDVHQGLSKQMMEGTYSYDQGYTPWNPPPYQHHAPQYNVYQSNGFGATYYGYEDPPPPCPPSQGNFKNIFHVLLQEKKEFWKNPKATRGPTSHRNRTQVHECLEEVEEENVDQEVADEDKELKGTEILQSASSEATPPESPSKLHFEWVSLSDMNLLGPQHYGLLETDAQLRVLCGVLDKREMDSLGMDESRFITCGELEFKAYNGHLHKLHNNRAKVGASNLKKHLGPWQSQEKLVDSQRNE
ncbi:hypothetical protein PIB30_095656 [Stylosanthes scabra]|uniref:Uncharacterized protein n=1 Tax=Stylosanthes scabra TaxID=79078 RepID=A0ABU6RWC7_9FABA|nr:hypothetical protein [Stylosanthes scabra]